MSFQISSHSSAIDGDIFHIAPEILGVKCTIVLVYVRNGSVSLQVIVSLQVGEAEMLAEFAYECDDEFYFIAEWICRFHSLFNFAASY